MEEQKLLGIDLSTASKELIEVLIEESEDQALFTEIAKANINRPEILRLLLENTDISDEVRTLINNTLHLPAVLQPEVRKVKKTPEMRSMTLLQKIQRLNFGEKRLLALRGGKEVRSILIKDPSREIVLTVLENPKITETEIELLAKSRSVPDEIIRKIVKKREWMKNYPILLAVVSNPKTPAGNAVSLLSELKTKDLAALMKNKNVSDAVRTASKRLVQARRGG
ncbi:MAG: hypothetical protein A2Y81_12290 [Nitrospirae bacterium RBG_13_43_8]|nr:MAG: hypothetical protein A2Y81_12290 [Nitrospirae bacterium RBG_13_43_8]